MINLLLLLLELLLLRWPVRLVDGEAPAGVPCPAAAEVEVVMAEEDEEGEPELEGGMT